LAEAFVVRRLMGQLSLPADSWLAGARDGTDVIGLALADLAEHPRQLLASGAVSTAVLGLEGDTLWLLRDLSRGSERHYHGSIPAYPLNELDTGTREKITDPDAARLFRAAREELRLLNAAQTAAAGLRAVQVAADYAGGR